MIVFSVDPGKASGLAIISWEPEFGQIDPRVEWSAEVQPEQFGDEVKRCLDYNKNPYEGFYVACESFTINAQTAKNSQAPWSLENIGVLKYLCREAGYPVEKIAFQAPVNAKNMFPNPALKTLKTWHRGGEGHANDAIRHGLLRLVHAGWKPVKLLSQNS
jgi:hypothetical protein